MATLEGRTWRSRRLRRHLSVQISPMRRRVLSRGHVRLACCAHLLPDYRDHCRRTWHITRPTRGRLQGYRSCGSTLRGWQGKWRFQGQCSEWQWLSRAASCDLPSSLPPFLMMSDNLVAMTTVATSRHEYRTCQPGGLTRTPASQSKERREHRDR